MECKYCFAVDGELQLNHSRSLVQEQKKSENKDDSIIAAETCREKAIYQEGVGFNLDCISTRLLHLAKASPPELLSH